MNTSAERTVFLAGIGGMGMAPLACYLAQAGWSVAGADDHLREPVAYWLRKAGVTLCRELPAEASCLVYSSAITAAHPWRVEATRRGLPCQRRGEMLAALARGHRLLGVAGSHGKTTCTALVIRALLEAGEPLSYVLGALFQGNETAPACFAGEGSWLVAEIDESDGTIEDFCPEVTLLVNADWDHPDRYTDRLAARAAFTRLLGRTSGSVVVPQTDACLPPDHGAARLLVVDAAQGGFMQANRALAQAAASLVAPAAQAPAEALVSRRQEVLWAQGECAVVTDYAHHPSEISALLEHYRRLWGGGHFGVVFQPHRYTRTRSLAEAFAEALSACDPLWLLPVYSAGEAPLPDGDTGAIARHLKVGVTSPQALAQALREAPGQGSTPARLLFVGAGDIDAWARCWVSDLERSAQWQRDLADGGLVQRQEPLAPLTTLRVGGAARFYAEPASVAGLARLWQSAQQEAIPVFFLGRGSNIIVSDNGYNGLVVSFRHPAWRACEHLGQGRWRVGPGLRLKELCAKAASQGDEGFEFLEGIPGNVGGSLRMNAGAMGGWIFDVVESVDLLHPDGRQETLTADVIESGYRCCPKLAEAVAVGAVLRSPAKAEEATIRARMEAYAQRRRASQPREPSAGCMFKNPPGDYAGRLIDAVGLKGFGLGKARVSAVHANFVVNEGGARAADVLAVARECRHQVASATGVLLEPEPLLLGMTWEEVWHGD